MAAPGDPNWQAQLAGQLGIKLTPAVQQYFNAWAQAEGGHASNNPFNTTQQAPGASSYNSVGVRNYSSPQQGVQATAQTLMNGRYSNIIAALKEGKDPVAMARALAASPWGTGALVLKVLGAGGGAQAPQPGPSAPQAPALGSPKIPGVPGLPTTLQSLLQNASPSPLSINLLAPLGGIAARTAQAAQADIPLPQKIAGLTLPGLATPGQALLPTAPGVMSKGHISPVASDYKFGRVDQGVDVSSSQPYRAIGSGVVTRIGQVAGGTNLGVYIKLDKPVTVNGHTYEGMYVWHTNPLVKPGDRVSKGQPIMSAGSAEIGFATSGGSPVAPLVGGLGAGTQSTGQGDDMLALIRGTTKRRK